MKKLQHTPGPWTTHLADDDGESIPIWGPHPDRNAVALIQHAPERSDRETYDNAVLLMLAPVMYETLLNINLLLPQPASTLALRAVRDALDLIHSTRAEFHAELRQQHLEALKVRMADEAVEKVDKATEGHPDPVRWASAAIELYPEVKNVSGIDFALLLGKEEE